MKRTKPRKLKRTKKSRREQRLYCCVIQSVQAYHGNAINPAEMNCWPVQRLIAYAHPSEREELCKKLGVDYYSLNMFKYGSY